MASDCKWPSPQRGLCGEGPMRKPPSVDSKNFRAGFRRVMKGEGELSKGVVERRTSNESALKIGQNHKLLFVSRSSGRRLQLPELCKISRRQDLRCFFQFPLLSALSTKEATKVLTLPISIIRSLGSCNNILPALLSLPVNYFQEKQQGFFLIILHGFFQG